MSQFFIPYQEHNEQNGDFRYTDKTAAVKEFVDELIKLGYPKENIVYHEFGIEINDRGTVLHVVRDNFSSNTTYKLKYGNITLADTNEKWTFYGSYKLLSLSLVNLKQLPAVLLADTEETKAVLAAVYNDYENGRLADFPTEDKGEQEKYLKALFNKIWQEKGYTENHLAVKIDKSWQDFITLVTEWNEVVNQVYKTVEESYLQKEHKNKNYDIQPLLEKAWRDKGYIGQELASKVERSLPIVTNRIKVLISTITIQRVVKGHLTRQKIYLDKLESLPEIKALREAIHGLSPSLSTTSQKDRLVATSKNAAAKAAIVNLNKLLTNYLKKGDFSEASYTKFKEAFNSELRSKEKDFSQYLSEEYKSMVLKNIAVCLTGIGILAVVAKLVYSKVTVGRALGFFDKTRDNRQAEKIKEAVEKITPDLKVK